MDIEYKINVKKLLCYNMVNGSKCVYKGKCMFAHNLEEQKKEPLREYIYEMINSLEDLSNIDIYEDNTLLDELTILTKECKNCLNKRCPGGYNCKFGACTKDYKICYNDLMYGKCYNTVSSDEIGTKRCFQGVHLTEKNFISYYQRIPLDLYSSEFSIFSTEYINYNSKNNIISLLLNNETINIVKDLVSNKINNFEYIKNYNNNKYFINNKEKDNNKNYNNYRIKSNNSNINNKDTKTNNSELDSDSDSDSELGLELELELELNSNK